jgi:hypothetical protein
MKLNHLYRLLKKASAAFLVLSLMLPISCNNDDETTMKTTTAQFIADEQTVSENGAPLSITIDFDKGIEANGTITIDITGTGIYGTDYTTNPKGNSGSIEVLVTEGQTAAQFTITPINNALLGDDDKTVEFTISEVSKALEIGDRATNLITITDDEGPTRANFALSSSSTSENLTDGIDVTINLTSAAPGTGSVTVSFTSLSTYGTHFTTLPAASAGQLVVPVTQFATSVTFKVKPVDDVSLNASREIEFVLSDDGGVVELGDAILEHNVTITDNEIASVATFAVPSSTMDENDAGLDVTIALSPETTAAGTVTVSLASDNATYGDHYSVEGATVTNGSFPVAIASGNTSVSFKVVPVDNGTNNESLVISFTLTSPTGIITLGSAIEHELTVVDDEIDPVKVDIDDVRALYQGSPATIEIGGYIEGTVTSSMDNVAGDIVFVQDATGGIALQFTSDNSTLALGDSIKVKVGNENTGVQVNSSQGLIQIEGLTYGLVEELSTGHSVTPTIITVAQANSGNYQANIVTFENVYLKEANGTETYAGNNTISDGTNEIVTFVRDASSPQALFKDDVAEEGIGSITGVMTVSGAGATPQLLLRNTADVNLSIVGTLTLNGTINDFGSVDNGATSTSQSFTVSGTTLVKNVFVTAPTNFKVSLNDVDYFSSLELDFNTVNAGPVQIYVKFTPTSGVDGVKSGTLTVASIGAEAKTISLSGTETSSTLILDENFDYGGSDNSDITVATSNWTRHSGTQGPQYSFNGLTYTGYVGSGIGGAISFTNGGSGVNDGDVNRKFTLTNTTSDVYVSFLVSMSSALAGEDYFFHVGPNTVGTTFRGRVFGRSNGAGWSLSLSKSSEANVDNATVLNFNQTYLVVMKYSYSTVAANDDVVKLYVYDSGVPSTSEPGTPLITIGPVGTGTASDPADIGSVTVRQATNTPTGKIDGIRVAKAWDDLFD